MGSMEEVDGILLFNLKDMGVDLEDVKTLADLKAEHIYAACYACLRAIDESKVGNFPQNLPRTISSKVGITSELANTIKNSGYKGDLDYHQLMYPTNASIIRKLLMWLIDAAPKKSISGGSGGASEGVAIDDAISKELAALLQDTWAPSFAITNAKNKLYVSDLYFLSSTNLIFPSKGRKLQTTPGLQKYYQKYLPVVTKQPAHRAETAPSIFESNLAAVSEQQERENEWNTKGLGSNLNPMAYNKKKSEGIAKMMAGFMKNTLNNIENESGQKMNDFLNNLLNQDAGRNLSGFERKVKFTTEEQIEEAVKLSEEEIAKKREEELEALQAELSKYRTAKENLDKELQTIKQSIHQFEAKVNEQLLETQRLEKEYMEKKVIPDLLGNADENILQLQKLNAQNAGRLVELATEWEKHRVPLIEQIRTLRSQIAGTKDETKIKLEKIIVMRDQIKLIGDELHSKDEKYNELLEQFNKAPKDLTRTYYTNRILDIVKNVKKQKVDINKILLDTRNSQKEINSVTDTLNRIFSLTDELIFQDAKKDPVAKEIYKLTVNINDSFKKLTSSVEETGKIRNEILQLESKIEALQERTGALNSERIEEDLREIRAENKALMAKIQNGN